MINHHLARPIAWLVLSLTTASCVSEAYLQQQAEYNRTIPTCTGAVECRAMMQLAKAWVLANSRYSIRIDSEDRIETTGWVDQRYMPARVNLVQLEGDEYQILVEVGCGMPRGDCQSIWEPAIEFNKLLQAASE